MNDQQETNKDIQVILSIVKYLLISLIVGLTVYFGWHLLLLLLPFVIGYVLARTSTELVSGTKNIFGSLRKKKKDRQSHEDSLVQSYHQSRAEKNFSVLIYFLILLIFISLLVAIILIIIGQLRSLTANLPSLFGQADFFNRIISSIEQFSERLGGIIPEQSLNALQSELGNIQQKLLQNVTKLVGTLLNGLMGFAGNLPVIFFMFVVVIMSGFYFINDRKTIYSFLHRNITSHNFRLKTLQLIDSLFNKLFRVLGGYILLLILTYLMAYIGLLVIKMPYAAIWALVIAIIDLLPILGITTTMIPMSIYMFIQGDIVRGIGILVIMLIIIFIRRFIEPPILGSAMHLHPLATLISMVIGVGLYGLGGLLFGPIVLVVVLEVVKLFGIDKGLRDWVGRLLTRLKV